jgi:DNA-directed RNA polymerase subunit RPC12/RpoP
MAIEVQCAACGKKLRAPDNQAGRVGKCPACKSEIVVPATAKSADVGPASVPISPPRDAAIPRQAAGAQFPSAHPRASPLASTMDDEFALPPAASGPGFGESQFGAGSSGDSAIEPKHWFALHVALKTTEIALLVEWISCSLIGLAAVGIMLSSSSGRGDITTGQVLLLLALWGGVGMLLGWTALATGWIVCLLAWPSDRRLLMGSAISAGVCVLTILVVISLGMFGIIGSAQRGATERMISPTATMIIVSLASAVSLILFGFFLSKVQLQLGRENIEMQPIIYTAVIGTLTVWCLIANLAITPTSRFMMWLILLSNIGTFVGEFLWLWLVNAFASRDLRVSHAWKRL